MVPIAGLTRYTVASLIMATAVLASGVVHSSGTDLGLYSRLLYTVETSESGFNAFIVSNAIFVIFVWLASFTAHILIGELTEVEKLHLTKIFIEFVMVKLLVPNLFHSPGGNFVTEALWFSVLGILWLYVALALERYDQKSVEHQAPAEYIKQCVVISTVLIFVYMWWRQRAGVLPGHSLYLYLEMATLVSTVLQLMIKYIIHLIDSYHPLARRGVWLFYVEVVTDAVVVIAPSIHFLYFLKSSKLSLSFMNPALFFRSGAVIQRLWDKYGTYRKYVRVLELLSHHCHDATADELARDDTCTICREHMDTARTLPCGHCFHLQCIRSWVEQRPSCPVCHRSLYDTVNPAAVPRAWIDTVSAVFPQVPVDRIINDLRETGSTAVTLNRIAEDMDSYLSVTAQLQQQPQPRPAEQPSQPAQVVMETPKKPEPQRPDVGTPTKSVDETEAKIASLWKEKGMSAKTSQDRQKLMQERIQSMKERGQMRLMKLEEKKSSPSRPEPQPSSSLQPNVPQVTVTTPTPPVQQQQAPATPTSPADIETRRQKQLEAARKRLASSV